MSEMIERVALAMQKELGRHMKMESPDWQHTAFRYTARLAIAAMREPTEAMTEPTINPKNNDWDEIWRAMIDAALKE